MKILCIGRNYAAHIEELKNERPAEPVVFTKPDTALLTKGEPFYYPDFSNDIHYECEILIRICREGKSIDPAFAHKYYDQIGLGIDFTARDLQTKAKEKGLPWALAKGFNGSAPISHFVDKEGYDLRNLDFSLRVNGVVQQQGNTSMMLWTVAELIAYVSRFFTLKTGDILFTGTPEGVGPVRIGDRLEGFIGEEKFLDFEVK